MFGWWRRIQLKSGDPKLRERAAQAIGKAKDRGAVDALIPVLRDSGGFSKDVNTYYPAPVAAWALGEIGDLKAVEPLICAFDSLGTRREAVAALVKIGLPAVDPLLKVARDPSQRCRSEAALALGGIRDRKAVPALIELLRSREDRTQGPQCEAARALGMMGDPAAVDALVGALSEDTVLLTEVVWALGEIGDLRAVAPLLKLNPSGRAGKAVAEALGKLPDPRTLARLVELVTHWDNDVRTQAENALRSKGPEAAPILLDALRTGETKTQRAVAARLLGEMKYQQAREALLEAAWDEEYPLRCEAVKALTNLGWQPATDAEQALQLIVQPPRDEELVRRLVGIGKPAVAPLIASLRHDDERGSRINYRAVMARVLGAIGDETAAQALADAATDYNYMLRAIAADALVKIGPASVEPLLGKLRCGPRNPEDILKALGAIGDGRARDELQRYAGPGPGYDKVVQDVAQEALRKLEKPR